jgi:hypothetical protein
LKEKKMGEGDGVEAGVGAAVAAPPGGEKHDVVRKMDGGLGEKEARGQELSDEQRVDLGARSEEGKGKKAAVLKGKKFQAEPLEVRGTLRGKAEAVVAAVKAEVPIEVWKPEVREEFYADIGKAVAGELAQSEGDYSARRVQLRRGVQQVQELGATAKKLSGLPGYGEFQELFDEFVGDGPDFEKGEAAEWMSDRDPITKVTGEWELNTEDDRLEINPEEVSTEPLRNYATGLEKVSRAGLDLALGAFTTAGREAISRKVGLLLRRTELDPEKKADVEKLYHLSTALRLRSAVHNMQAEVVEDWKDEQRLLEKKEKAKAAVGSKEEPGSERRKSYAEAVLRENADRQGVLEEYNRHEGGFKDRLFRRMERGEEVPLDPAIVAGTKNQITEAFRPQVESLLQVERQKHGVEEAGRPSSSMVTSVTERIVQKHIPPLEELPVAKHLPALQKALGESGALSPDKAGAAAMAVLTASALQAYQLAPTTKAVGVDFGPLKGPDSTLAFSLVNMAEAVERLGKAPEETKEGPRQDVSRARHSVETSLRAMIGAVSPDQIEKAGEEADPAAVVLNRWRDLKNDSGIDITRAKPPQMGARLRGK